MKNLFRVSLFLLGLWSSGNALAASTGIQAIGFSNWTSNSNWRSNGQPEGDVQMLADDYAQIGGSLELSFLPYEFNPGNPFKNADAFARDLLPRLNGRLTITGYLWFHRWSPRFDWSAFSTSHPNANQVDFRNTYLSRVAAFDVWAKSVKAWARTSPYGDLSGKISFILSPYLEDDCPTANSYGKLIDAIRVQQSGNGVRTGLRRSAGDSLFRVDGVRLELHGRYEQAIGRLVSGDAFSNDGNFVWIDRGTVPWSVETPISFPGYGLPTSSSEFISNQMLAIRNRGVTVLLWRPAYNGLPDYSGTTPPSQRRRLTPISTHPLENPALTAIVSRR